MAVRYDRPFKISGGVLLQNRRHKAGILRTVKTPCLDDHEINPAGFEVKGSLVAESASIVLKVLYTARMIRPDIYHSVNTLAREVTRWTRACDKRLHRLMCYLHHNSDLVLTCHLGDPAHKLKLALYSDSSFADCLSTSKSCSGVVLQLVGPNTCVPLTWL